MRKWLCAPYDWLWILSKCLCFVRFLCDMFGRHTRGIEHELWLMKAIFSVVLMRTYIYSLCNTTYVLRKRNLSSVLVLHCLQYSVLDQLMAESQKMWPLWNKFHNNQHLKSRPSLRWIWLPGILESVTTVHRHSIFQVEKRVRNISFNICHLKSVANLRKTKWKKHPPRTEDDTFLIVKLHLYITIVIFRVMTFV